MDTPELEMKIFYAVKFIVRPLAIPDQAVVDAAEAATREIVRHQKSCHQQQQMDREHSHELPLTGQ